MEICCEYKIIKDDKIYACFVTSAAITKRCAVRSFKGGHIRGYANKDVTELRFLSTTVHYLPSGLHQIFPNLKKLVVQRCGLKEITSDDLIGLGNLESLNLSHNCMKLLPDALFVNTRKLHTIDFSHNQLEFMSSRLFNPIADNQWWLADFSKNKKIDAYHDYKYFGWFKSLRSVVELKYVIDSSCSPTTLPNSVIKKTSTTDYKKFNQLDECFDFTIVTGKKEIQVHKCVLAAQSPVFASMFKNDFQVMATNKLEIKDCKEEVVEEFMRSLYTGEVGSEDNALDLFSLASTFDVNDLKATFEEIVIKNINEQTAVKAFKLGNLFNCQELIDVAFDKLKKTFPNDIQSDGSKHEPKQVKKLAVREFQKSC